MPKRLEVDIDGRRLSLSNLDKVFYPETGFTKGQLIDYYTRVAPVLLGHLRGRPLTLKRYPDGVTGPYFYEKQCPRHRPDWVATAPVWSRHNSRTIDFCLADDLPTLVWLANLADLELHTSLALAVDVTAPTIVAFDLDPGPPATIVRVRRGGAAAARGVRAPRARGVPQDLGLQGHAGLRPAQHAGELRADQAVRPRASRRCSSAATPVSWCRT